VGENDRHVSREDPRLMAAPETSSPEAVATYQRKRRIGRIVIASFLALVVVVEVATFIGRSQTASTDAKPHTFYGVAGSTGPNFVTVAAHILEISPTAGTMQVRVTIDPHGSYALPDGALARSLNLDADGYAGGSITLAAGEIPPPVQLSLTINGDLSQYPLDSYATVVTVHLTEVDVSATGKEVKLPTPVPTQLVVDANQHDWALHIAKLGVWPDGAISINIAVDRGIATRAFAFFELFMMLSLAVIAVAITYAAIISSKPLEFSLFAWLGAMLFALPAIRGTMPGIPGVGTLIDYTVFFWCLLAVAGCLITAAIVYIATTVREHRPR
jgi:hypothetical protein